ncbi:MAG: cell division protein ZapA [Rickettsiales bacterium]|jgi:cell division protein ZapA (FtsZ GTPase activity inhibitor)|nr:cell division protein ZapA [Rickettsiales bacterium]
MSNVALRIVNQNYVIGCEDGQEARLHSLAKVVDAKAREILKQIGPLPEDALLATTCIVLADELGGASGAGVSDEDLEQILKRMKQITKKLNQGGK